MLAQTLLVYVIFTRVTPVVTDFFANSPWIAENFNTVQIVVKIPVTEKIQIAALIPIIFIIGH
jgi:hypothetical protein